MKRIKLYELSVVAFFLVLPVSFICGELLLTNTDIQTSILKWFVFYAVGMRLLTAGIKQAIEPEFTAKEIFGITDSDCVIHW